MSREIIKIPIAVSDWPAMSMLEHAHLMPANQPMALVHVLTGEQHFDDRTNAITVELHTGAHWYARIEFDAMVAQQKGAPGLLELAWHIAGDPTPDVGKMALREAQDRVEYLRGELRRVEAERIEAVRRANKAIDRADSLSEALYGGLP